MQGLQTLGAGADFALLAVLSAIFAVAAVLTGLSGLGFSAVGSLSLAFLSPELALALLTGLSMLTQISGAAALWRDLRPHLTPWHRRDGIVPCVVGGLIGLPLGLTMLSRVGLWHLDVVLSLVLVCHSTWSLLRPPGERDREDASPSCSFLVGTVAGALAAFAALPGSALVFWTARAGIGKAHGRALTQSFVLAMQLVATALLLARHPALFGRAFWGLFVAAAPVALLGNQLGVAIYRRTPDRCYRRVTLAALAIAGVGLLGQLAWR